MEDQNIWYAVIAVSGTIIGAVLGGGISYFNSKNSIKLQNELNQEKEAKDFRRSKIESAYNCLNSVYYNSVNFSLDAIENLKNKKILNREKIDLKTTSVSELNLIVDLYLPELSDDFKRLRDKYNDLLETVYKCQSEDLTKEDLRKSLKLDLKNADTYLNDSLIKFRISLTQLIKEV